MIQRMRLISLWLGVVMAGGATVSSSVTFYRDVLPILQNRCQSCHRSGQLAPISFMTYKETRPWAEAMKYVVVSRQMPPWFAERPYVPSAFVHEGLKLKEIETIVSWVEQGAPAGDPKDAPPPLYLQEGRRAEGPAQTVFKPAAWH